MTNEELKQAILNILPEAVIEEGKQFLTVTIACEKILLLAEKLKNDSQFLFDYLFCLTGVDWIKEFTVVYHLRSTALGHSLVLKAKIADRVNPVVETVSRLWPTAEFHEREVYDLLGIKFNNHPDLRRILLEDDWKGFPLRKDYVDEENIVELE